MTVQAAAQWLRERDNFLLLTHVRPDGDTLGSAAALCEALNALGKTAYLLKNPGDLTRYEGFLTFSWAPEGFAPDHVVAVDIATEELLPEGAAQDYQGKSQLCIDHHPSNQGYAQQTCLDADAAACGEIIYRIIRELGVWSESIAQALYIAISTDCGGFLYSNTTPETHRIAAELMEHLDVRKVNKHFFKTKRFVELKLESRLLESEAFSTTARCVSVRSRCRTRPTWGLWKGTAKSCPPLRLPSKGWAVRLPSGSWHRTSGKFPCGRWRPTWTPTTSAITWAAAAMRRRLALR